MKSYLFFPFFFLLAGFGFSQQTIERSVVANGGSTSTVGTRTLESTIGETAVNDFSSGSFFLSEGFQQGTLVITGMDEESLNQLSDIRVYPVPTHAELKIHLGLHSQSEVVVTIFDIQGKKLEMEQKVLSENELEFSFQNVVQGTYLVEIVMPSNSEKRTWKIQKVN